MRAYTASFDKRPSAEINIKLPSLNEGAIHGYRHEDPKGMQCRGTRANCSARSPH